MPAQFPIKPPVLGREQAVQLGAFYRVATAEGVGFQVYQDRIYEATTAGTTETEQPVYDTTIGNPTTDGTALLTARDSFMRVATVAAVASNGVFEVSDALDAFADGWFTNGALTFETGNNAGRTLEIKSWTQATRTLERTVRHADGEAAHDFNGRGVIETVQAQHGMLWRRGHDAPGQRDGTRASEMQMLTMPNSRKLDGSLVARSILPPVSPAMLTTM